MKRSLPLSLVLMLLAGSAGAQELPGFEQEQGLDELGLRPARLVVVVTRYCRHGTCVWLSEYREVTGTDAAEDSEDGHPAIHPPARAQRGRSEPALAVSGQTPATPAPAPAPVPAPTCGTAEETEAFRLMNAHRAQLGLATLACDLTALSVARAHSQDMCTRGYFDHYSPEGSAPWDRLRRAGTRFRMAGENIGLGYQSAQSVHQGWLESPGHRQNIERPTWTRAAVGLVVCPRSQTTYWTQLFTR